MPGFQTLPSRNILRILVVVVGSALWFKACVLTNNRKDTPVPPGNGIAPPAKNLDEWESRYTKQEPPPAHLKPDPEVWERKLKNGVRYAIQKQQEDGQVSLRLVVLAGSMHETEEERGLAHFVEHMALQKSKNAPDGHVTEALERLGLRSGADTNASTFIDHTVYQLDLPNPEEKTLESAFGFLRDVVDGLLFNPADVEAERRIILREMEERSSRNALDIILPAIFPEVPAAHRIPIGLKAVLENTTASQLRTFWQRHYVPGRIAIIVAGDMEPVAIQARIERHFSNLPDRPAPPEPACGNPQTGEGMTVQAVHQEGDTLVSLTIAVPRPVQDKVDSPEQRRQEMAQKIGLRMLNTRLDRKLKEDRQIYGATRVRGRKLIRPIHWLEILNPVLRPEHLMEMLPPILSEWNRTRKYGFTELEFAEARNGLNTFYLKTYVDRLHKPTAAAADLMVEQLVDHRVSESPEDELNRARTDLAALTLQETEVLKVTISGDFSPTEVLKTLAGTFGTLPVRTAWETPCPHPVLSSALKGVCNIKSRSQNETACLMALALPQPLHFTDAIQQNLMAELLRLRLLRTMLTEAGLSYGPTAGIRRFFDTLSPWLLLNVPCASSQTSQVGELLRQVLMDFKIKGWSTDEFRRAAIPFAATVKKNTRDPLWWLNALDHPETIPPSSFYDYQQLLLLEAGTRTLARQLSLETALELRTGSD